MDVNVDLYVVYDHVQVQVHESCDVARTFVGILQGSA